jgi:hypothetical protein
MIDGDVMAVDCSEGTKSEELYECVVLGSRESIGKGLKLLESRPLADFFGTLPFGREGLNLLPFLFL